MIEVNPTMLQIPADGTFVLTVWNSVTKDVLTKTEFTGSYVHADNRLAELWNEHAAHIPGRGMKAKMVRKGERSAMSTISG